MVETNILIFVLQFQEVGSIIGKKGEIVKRFRDEVSFRFRTKSEIYP